MGNATLMFSQATIRLIAEFSFSKVIASDSAGSLNV
jgi:hypothetical protein